ncbi:MAG: serine hydrolase [Sediminibacterium sp.]|nr:serine hydrolase [Sediminibacterium sp.]
MLVLCGALIISTEAQQKNVSGPDAPFDKILSEQFKPNEPGGAALVARKGEIIYKKAFGMANMELDVAMQADNIFRIGSITKQFTAVAILQLVEQGKLNLQDEITRFIPDYPVHEYRITIEHLLTHTSGIPDYAGLKDTVQRAKSDLTPARMIEVFKNLPMRFAPGTKWEYSNSGYFLLGYVIEKITGKTYADYLQENIFKPLGMTHSQYANDVTLIKKRATGYTLGEKGYVNAAYLSMTQPYAAGAIQSTVEDLFKWNQAVTSYKLVKKENLDKAFTRYTLADGKETAYGFGWRMGNVYESPSLWHGGLISGYMSMAVYLPKEDIFAVVLSNCDGNSPEVVTNKLAALAAGKAFEHKEIAVADAMMHDYPGVYENQKGQQRIITVSGNKLFSQLGRGPKSLIMAYQRDKFYFDADAMATIEFTRNKTGAIEELTSGALRGNDIWNKTSKPLPDENGIKLADDVLEAYTGVYEISPDFSFSVTKEQNQLFLKATGQEKVAMFAETATGFFLKVNGAQLEFVKDNTGKVTKAILKQGARETVAKRVK